MTPEHTRSASYSELKVLSTPSKSKGKGKKTDEDTWQLGWWDLQPLVDGIKRPIQWTRSSIILTAHPSLPQLVCLQFPSNSHFDIPPPPPLSSSPASYDPPSVIAASPLDDWIFAYFPGKDADGVGALWRRGLQLDSWTVKEWWTFAGGAGVVEAKWLGPERDWVVSEENKPTRLPSLGPAIPQRNSILLLVTEAHIINVYYIHPQNDAVKMLSASLCRPCRMKDGDPRAINERVDGPRGMGLITHSAIGLGYNENSIIIATHSKAVPSPPSDLYSPDTVDLSLSLSATPPAFGQSLSHWESWDDENIIEICQVKLGFYGLALTLSTDPLPPIYLTPRPAAYLTDLVFVTSPPRPGARILYTPTQTHARHPSTPKASPAMTHASTNQSPGKPFMRSPGKSGQSKIRMESRPDRSEAKMHLVCAFVDFGDYSSQPKSEMALHSFYFSPVVHPQSKPSWTHYNELSRTLPVGVAAVFAPTPEFSPPGDPHFLVGVLDFEGVILKGTGREATIGKFRVVRVLDLTFSEKWEPSSIITAIGARGVDPPFSVTISPNRALLCTVSPSTKSIIRTSIHHYPTYRTANNGTFGDSESVPRRHLSNSLALAVHARKDPSDIIHNLTSSSVTVRDVEVTLEGAIQMLETHESGSKEMWLVDMAGVALDVYRQKSVTAKSDSLREDLQSRWQTAQDVCFIAAMNMAWEDCLDGDGYDLEAVWQLIGVSGWLMEFLEKILKECVLFSSAATTDGASGQGSAPPPENDEDDLFGSTSSPVPTTSLAGPPLLHLVHLFPLEHLHRVLNHVKQFRSYLGTLSARAENAHIAKESIVDLAECCGINLNAFEQAVAECVPDVKLMKPEYARSSFGAMRPSPGSYNTLRKLVSKIVDSNVIDKAHLFIKPDDLIDGMLGLSVATPTPRLRDVISKAILPRQRQPIVCSRCGGKSEIGVSPSPPGNMSVRWATWERAWTARCICGGMWRDVRV
ncbi:hypothetical protein BD410DRAFT_781035 [Rickenella mellea]|uniref:Mediator complex subunit 16 C-terminal domain-containing protein n=1 Tax=Rickenella mellea TaxID=50990 RepID=A0A4Y7QLI1_9AGAM|nr:hypothetical protein BD410DRAFT_781035 [Rickenella mellea]